MAIINPNTEIKRISHNIIIKSFIRLCNNKYILIKSIWFKFKINIPRVYLYKFPIYLNMILTKPTKGLGVRDYLIIPDLFSIFKYFIFFMLNDYIVCLTWTIVYVDRAGKVLEEWIQMKGFACAELVF